MKGFIIGCVVMYCFLHFNLLNKITERIRTVRDSNLQEKVKATATVWTNNR